MRCNTCGCTLFSCQCPNGPTNALVEPIPDNCLPFDGNTEKLAEFLRGPKIDDNGRIQGGTYHGMTVADVLADREAYRRACGE